MGKIIILDENTSNKIAAGEVIERPASVVKELVENSIDAGASNISVEIKNGGIAYIKIVDNGSGIDEDDLEIAFERHSTSKIRSSEDLFSISTLGFRGEALASIAAVSTVEVMTRTLKNTHGMYVKVQGGAVKDVRQTGCPVGTSFTVRELFYNTPARFKFLKKDSTEAGYVSDIIERIALANPNISFRLISGGGTTIHTPGNNDLLSTIFSIYGKDTANGVSQINYSDNRVKITGYAGRPEIARSNRNYQSIYVNGRYVKSKLVSSSIDEAYKTMIMKNKHPFIIINVEVNPMLVDVNVHPTKMEVRFTEEQEIFRSIYHAVNSALLNNNRIRDVNLNQRTGNSFGAASIKREEPQYIQQDISDLRTALVRDVQPDEDSTEEELLSPKGNNEKTSSGTEKSRSFNVRNITPPIQAEWNKAYGPSQEAAAVNQKLAGSLIIGQAFSTYIILQQGDILFLVDQHAAHERLLYEKLKNNVSKGDSEAQMLVSPIVIELTQREIKFLEEQTEIFDKLGFIYENFGNNSIILRAIPCSDENIPVKEAFLDVLDHIISTEKKDFNLLADEALYSMACKAAVKANWKLSEPEIKNLLNELDKMENPFTCPHGRPTAVKITKYEFEKLFKRIV
jgi:DNA mismatch repair protein MutL